jgi:hypothetical protein
MFVWMVTGGGGGGSEPTPEYFFIHSCRWGLASSGPARAETPAWVELQWLDMVKDYIKPSPTSRIGCGSHSLTPIAAKLKIPRSPPLVNRTWSPLGIQRRRPSSTSSPKVFHRHPHLLGEFVPSVSLETLGVVLVDYSCICGVLASVSFLGASNWVVDVRPKLRVRVSVGAPNTTA